MADLKRLAIPLILILALFAGGVLAGRAWFPRVQVQQVDPKIIGVAVPGETKYIPYAVPGAPYPVQVEVTRYVDRIGRDRIVTVTQPVEVPVEVIRREWPQTVTVTVGSVLTREYGWATPVNPQLLIGQIAPGVYAVSAQMEGWRISSVQTETKVAPIADTSRWQLQVRPLAGIVSFGGSVALVAGVTVEVSRGHLVVSIAGGQSTAGSWGMGIVSYRF